jgi:IS30 family transposase
VKEYRGYYPLTADDSTRRRRQRRQRRRKLVQDARLRAHVIEKLELCWSPEQIAGPAA